MVPSQAEGVLVVFYHPFQRSIPKRFPKTSRTWGISTYKFSILVIKTWTKKIISHEHLHSCTFLKNQTIASETLPLGIYGLHPITDFTYVSEEVGNLGTLSEEVGTLARFMSCDILKAEMAEYSRVPRVPTAEVAEHSRVPRLPKAEVTEHSRVPWVPKAEMTEYSRVPLSQYVSTQVIS